MKNNKTLYLKASYLLAEQQTIAREFGELEKIRDNYAKYESVWMIFLCLIKMELCIFRPGN
jgi:hypothetical protein